VGKAHPCFQGSIRSAERPTREDLAKAPRDAWSRDTLYRSAGVDGEHRPGLRHELASALALFSVLQETSPDHPALLPRLPALLGESEGDRRAGRLPAEWEARLATLPPERFDLLAYLVAAHHGKVRLRLHAAPQDDEYFDGDGRGLPVRGVREGDRLNPVEAASGEALVPPVALSLEPARLGLSERTGPSWTERTLGLLRQYGPGALGFLEAILRAADIHASRLETPDPLLVDEIGKEAAR
jgi:CRISPR-associated endonuclease/helicase Cas3